MRRVTLSEDEAAKLHQGDPVEYYNGDEWIKVQVVRPLSPEHDTVRVTTGTMEIDAVLGELRQ